MIESGGSHAPRRRFARHCGGPARAQEAHRGGKDPAFPARRVDQRRDLEHPRVRQEAPDGGGDPLHRRDPGPVRPDRPGRAARQPRRLWPGLPVPGAELGPRLFRLDVRLRRQPRARRLPVRPPRRHLQRPGCRDRSAAHQEGPGVSRRAVVLAGALHVLLPRRQLRLHRHRHPCALGRQPEGPRSRARHAGRVDRRALQGQGGRGHRPDRHGRLQHAVARRQASSRR